MDDSTPKSNDETENNIEEIPGEVLIPDEILEQIPEEQRERQQEMIVSQGQAFGR